MDVLGVEQIGIVCFCRQMKKTLKVSEDQWVTGGQKANVTCSLVPLRSYSVHRIIRVLITQLCFFKVFISLANALMILRSVCIENVVI